MDAHPDRPTAGHVVPAPGTWEAPSPALPRAEVLDAEMHRLLLFAEGARAPGGGFGNLDDNGRLQMSVPIQTWVSTRMTYCFALGSLLGREGDAERVDHGLAALLPGGALRDDVNGGWYSSVSLDARATDTAAERLVVDDTKAAYAHAFVVLAASAAVVAGRPEAERLLADALSVIEGHFWDDAAGMMRESFSADWAVEEAYRGANANMHSVEAFLAAADALGGDGAQSGIWRERAGRIVERIVHGIAREADWRLPEHFDTHYIAVLDYNADDRAHPFRPYGVTPGHLFEWARLALHLLAAESAAGAPVRPWLLPDAVALYRTAVEIGWAPDGRDGFVYTTGFDGEPITRARMHWVVTEAMGAAAALHQMTGEAAYAEDHRRWWQFATDHLMDLEHGSWHAELDAHLRPAAETWNGKPDVYHALQATLVPRLSLTPMFAAALRRR